MTVRLVVCRCIFVVLLWVKVGTRELCALLRCCVPQHSPEKGPERQKLPKNSCFYNMACYDSCVRTVIFFRAPEDVETQHSQTGLF